MFLIFLAVGCESKRAQQKSTDAYSRSTAQNQASSQQVRPSVSASSGINREDTLLFRVHDTLPKMILRINRRGQDVRSLDLFSRARPDERLQRLKVSSSHIEYNRDLSEYVKVVDLNFDNYNDLGFMTARAMVNFRFDYWRYDPQKEKFVSLGNHPLLDPNPKKEQLTTFTRGGHAGMLHERRTYRPSGDSLAVVRRVQQEHLRNEGETKLYLRTTEERGGPKQPWRAVHKEIIAAHTEGKTRLDTLQPDSLR